MKKHKSCYRKAHSGTTGFAPCQVCIDQDICETDYMESPVSNEQSEHGKQ